MPQQEKKKCNNKNISHMVQYQNFVFGNTAINKICVTCLLNI